MLSVFFTNDNTGYVAGTGGTILKTTSGTIVSIDEPRLLDSDITIFPNPSHNLVTIGINKQIAEDILVRILSVTGKQVLLGKFHDQSHIRMDCSSLVKGVYMVMIETKSGKVTKKLIIM